MERQVYVFAEYSDHKGTGTESIYEKLEDAKSVAKGLWTSMTRAEREEYTEYPGSWFYAGVAEQRMDDGGEWVTVGWTPVYDAVNHYFINYHTGAGDEWVSDDIILAMDTADKHAAYTQRDISIMEDGVELFRRTWYGVEPSDEERELFNVIEIGEGFYADWTEV